VSINEKWVVHTHGRVEETDALMFDNEYGTYNGRDRQDRHGNIFFFIIRYAHREKETICFLLPFC